MTLFHLHVLNGGLEREFTEINYSRVETLRPEKVRSACGCHGMALPSHSFRPNYGKRREHLRTVRTNHVSVSLRAFVLMLEAQKGIAKSTRLDEAYAYLSSSGAGIGK